MRHERRIIEAFKSNGIQRVLLINDGYDVPALQYETLRTLIDYFESTSGRDTCIAASLTSDQIDSASEAALDSALEYDPLNDAVAVLYRKFVDTREKKFDPGGHCEILKGATLNVLQPIDLLLKKCGKDLDIYYAGLND